MKNTLNIFRANKNSNYTVINNTVAKDKRLSLKAKGFFLIIMSLPDDWDFSINGIIKITKEGKTAVYTAVKELIEFGYCKRSYEYEKHEGKKVRSKVVYTFYEVSNNKGSDLNSGFLNLDNLNLDNQPQLNTYSNKILKRETLSNLETRQKVFKSELTEFYKTYDTEILKAFYNYWTETNPKTGKMRFENENFWNLDKRLGSWARKEKIFNKRKPIDKL